MDPHTALFQQHRPRLFGLAYRMLGSPGDAEDTLHDAWLRWNAQDPGILDDTEAWLVTVTTRLALDRLRRAKLERQHHVGPWLPEPLLPSPDQPDGELERTESLTLGFLLLLERLSPEERAAFLLHEVFDYSHAEAASILGISADATRQRVHRARRHLQQARARFSVSPEKQQRLLERFMQAMRHPTPATLENLFAEDAVLIADGGGRATAVLHPLCGSERITRLYRQIAAHYQASEAIHRVRRLNGAPALLTWVNDSLATVMWIETADDRIAAIHSLRDPLKLARLAAVTSRPGHASL